MIQLVIYSKATGDIVAYKSPVLEDAVDDEINGSLFADVDPREHRFYVKDGAIVERPQRPSIAHVWNGKTWSPDMNLAASEARGMRDRLLSESDWSELVGAEKRLGSKAVEWQKYRQELRDITKQAGFPLNIIWPEKPV